MQLNYLSVMRKDIISNMTEAGFRLIRNERSNKSEYTDDVAELR